MSYVGFEHTTLWWLKFIAHHAMNFSHHATRVKLLIITNKRYILIVSLPIIIASDGLS